MDMVSAGVSAKTHLTGAVRQGLENLLSNLKKLIEKEKKRKLEDEKSAKKTAKSNNLDLVSIYTTNSHKSVATNINEIEDLLKDSDSEEEDAKMDSKSQKSSKTNKTSKSDKKDKKSKQKSKEDKSGLAWLQENEEDDPLDLLDPMAIKRVLATKPLTKEELERKKQKEASSKNRGFKMSNDGKLIIDDEDEEDEDLDEKKSKKMSKKNKKQPDVLEDMMDTLSLSKKSQASKKSTKKRSMEEDSDDSDAEDMKSKRTYKSGGHGIHRNLDKEKKQADYGSEYKAKKARGDIKLKNKPDPFAYIPFNPAKLNKRKKAKLQGEFKGVVKAVQRGAQKGSKKVKRF